MRRKRIRIIVYEDYGVAMVRYDDEHGKKAADTVQAHFAGKVKAVYDIDAEYSGENDFKNMI